MFKSHELSVRGIIEEGYRGRSRLDLAEAVFSITNFSKLTPKHPVSDERVGQGTVRGRTIEAEIST